MSRLGIFGLFHMTCTSRRQKLVNQRSVFYSVQTEGELSGGLDY